jgi:hypothetical protein
VRPWQAGLPTNALRVAFDDSMVKDPLNLPGSSHRNERIWPRAP